MSKQIEYAESECRCFEFVKFKFIAVYMNIKANENTEIPKWS